MKMHVENLSKIIEKVNSSGSPVIVEGQKDKIALESIGIRNIICLRGAIFSFCEKLAEKYNEVFILTDLDSEGKKLFSKIKQNLERNKIKVDNSLRDFLYRETTLTQIEGLPAYLDKNEHIL
jgi:5S rRNA maturation endonuclease (ribonuclease M5)